MVRLVGLEPTTNGIETRYSIQLSYRRAKCFIYTIYVSKKVLIDQQTFLPQQE